MVTITNRSASQMRAGLMEFSAISSGDFDVNLADNNAVGRGVALRISP
jgi:hypothetical protein